ncbi:MAG: hypothetical protein ACRD0P_07370 [Stackebrandtia sp.]
MTVSGERLGAELYDLRRAGRISLPKVAAIYAQGSRHMHNTSWNEDEAFDTGGYYEYDEYEYEPSEDAPFGGADLGPEDSGFTAEEVDAEAFGLSFPNWQALRDQLQVYMAATSTSLSNAGLALELIARDYAADDSVAAAELERQSRGLGERPEIPEVKQPYDTHDTTTEHVDTPDIETPWGDLGLPDYDVEAPREEPTDPLPRN